MASQKNFAITPSVSITRSKFKRPSQHKTSFNLGYIVPIYVDSDILPGDTVSLDLGALVRMSTPIAPLMDNIFVDYYAFFCPHRLTFAQWKNFMGENTSAYGAATAIQAPMINLSSYPVTAGSLGDYMGLPVGTGMNINVSSLPGRAYYLVYNEWFRDQNVISPLGITTSNAQNLCVDPNNSNANYQYGGPLMRAAKISDYFTRALPYAQKGAAVTLPLGSEAPIIGGATFTNMQDAHNILFKDSGGNVLEGYLRSGVGGFGIVSDATASSAIKSSNLVADLTNATAATINQLRFAFQYQKFLEKDALYGTRYWEILKGHFGITAPDASLQRPEFLGHFRQHINIDQVLQTSESGTTALGTPGANSVSGKSGHLISKSFVEHGTLLILAVARHDQTYGQGINRMWTRLERKDYYFPVFANLGAQVIKNKEIFAAGSYPEGTFGFQEAWAEYRYRPSMVTGILNPARSNSLGFWTLANNFATAPTLSKSFIEQDRSNLTRALTTGNNGPDFIADFYFDATYVRPMPMYSLPGLIDHH